MLHFDMSDKEKVELIVSGKSCLTMDIVKIVSVYIISVDILFSVSYLAYVV